MDADTIVDLKQFITTTVSQSISHLEVGIHQLDQKIDALDVKLSMQIDSLGMRIDAVDQRIDGIDQKIDDLSAAIADALDKSNHIAGIVLKDHEHRIIRLERKTFPG